MRDVSLSLLDIAQNSVDAGATLIRIFLSCDGSFTYFTVEDNGCGMDEEALSNVLQEGFSSKGSHGMGLPLVKKDAEASGGRFEIISECGKGTKTEASFGAEVRIGNIGETFVTLVDEGYDTVFTAELSGKKIGYDSRELKSALSVAQLQSLGVLRLIREDINKFIRQNGGAML